MCPWCQVQYFVCINKVAATVQAVYTVIIIMIILVIIYRFVQCCSFRGAVVIVILLLWNINNSVLFHFMMVKQRMTILSQSLFFELIDSLMYVLFSVVTKTENWIVSYV